MRTGRASHATIALLASSCALDFSWPLDLVTTCETDAHCPEGLVCRFNSCGRDAVGQDGEPCNLDGRCEAGLLCDEIVCRKSRNNEPVPEWVVTAHAPGRLADVSLTSVEDGQRLLWSIQLGASALVGGRSPEVDDGSACTNCLAVADIDRTGTVTGLRALKLSTFAGIDVVSPGGGALGLDERGASVVARYNIDPSEFLAARHVVLDRISSSGGTPERLGEERTEAEQYSDLLVGAASAGRALVSFTREPLDGQSARHVEIAEFRMDATRFRSWRWELGEDVLWFIRLRVSGLDASRAPAVALLEAGEAALLGLPGEAPTAALVELLDAGETRLIGHVSGDPLIETAIATTPDGQVVACFGHVDTVQVVDAQGGTRDLPTRGDGVSASVVRFKAGRLVASATLPYDGFTTIGSCAVLPDGTTVVTGSALGDDPPRPARHPGAADRDLLIVGLDRDLAPAWTIRHGDFGNQEGARVIATDGGFVVAGTFGSTLNLGLGTYRSVSGGDAFLARYRVPAP